MRLINIYLYVFMNILMYIFKYKWFFTIIVHVGSDHIKVLDMESKIHKVKKDKDDAKQSKNNAMDKAQKLKDHMRSDLQITDEEYLSIMSEVHEYEESLKDAVEKMKGSQATFLEAHGSTLEVLKVAEEVVVSEERFHKAGERKFHWKDWDSKVSWDNLCLIFHNNYLGDELSLWIIIVYDN